MLYLSCAGVLILAAAFAGLMICEPRTIWSGALFVLLMLSLAVALLFVLYSASDWLTTHVAIMGLLIFLIFLAAVCILLLPFVLTVFFLVEGIRVLLHEGVKLPNLLSVLFAAVLLVCLVIWPLTGNPGRHAAGAAFFAAAAALAAYGLMLLAVYSLSAVFNLIHLKKRRNADYIVVLGAGLRGRDVTPLLAARIDRGIGLLRYNPGAMLVLSGGQGPGEERAESEAMADYAMERGVSADRILMEPESASTRENLLFSRRLMDRRDPTVVIVTTSYHVFRALLLARQQGIRCVGFGAKTKWYFALNAFLREFAGYLRLMWKRHLPAVVILAGIAMWVRLK